MTVMSDPKKKNGLGRGLGALLKDTEQPLKSNRDDKGPSIDQISIDSIEMNPYQPRTHFEEEALQELSESIKLHGIIQPITVRRLSVGKYQLISGERRTQASKRAGLKTLPAYIREANDQQMLEMALIENIQRENLNALEVALSYQRLISECKLKQEELGDRVGKKRTTVNNYLRLLKLPPDIQAAIRDQRLSMGHARAIVNVEEADKQLYIFNQILNEDLSVRATEELVRNIGQKRKEQTPAAKAKAEASSSNSGEINQLQTRLSSHFGTKINIKSDKIGKGEIKIPFVSVDDLNRILDILNL
ncbi:MAG: ParB/RepB/Spo0J family partition protein [Chitinophagaceae bacterium]|nr:ParB/RepB/Spo0J family partition protein [Chitinophagaceae bacterium]